MAIENSSGNPFENVEDRDNSESPQASEDGQGGGDMSVWSEGDREQRLGLNQREVDNLSSFTFPSGIMDTAINSFETGPRSEVALPRDSVEPSQELEDGQGGGDMDIWQESRKNKLLSLTVLPYVNVSKFSIPRGIISTAVDGFENGPRNNEKEERGNGQIVSGSVNGPGGPVSGVAAILSGGGTLSQKAVEGTFSVSSSPPDPVVSGPDGSPAVLSFAFVPENGIASSVEGIGKGVNSVQFEYSEINGSVTDYNGNGLSNERVAVTADLGSDTTTTSGDGSYSFQVPSGLTSIISLQGKGGVEKNIGGLETVEANFQYSGLEVSLSVPGGIPIPNAKTFLSIQGTRATTDETGSVLFTKVPPNSDGLVSIYNVEEREVSSGPQGALVTEEITFGVGVNGTISTSAGSSVSSVDVVAIDGEGRQYDVTSRSGGGFTVGIPSEGQVAVLASQNDRRFAAVQEVIDATENEITTVDFELEERENIGTTV